MPPVRKTEMKLKKELLAEAGLTKSDYSNLIDLKQSKYWAGLEVFFKKRINYLIRKTSRLPVESPLLAIKKAKLDGGIEEIVKMDIIIKNANTLLEKKGD